MNMVFYVVAFVFISFLWGFIVSRLALNKGYIGKSGSGKYFAMGFFFWFIGLLYVGFLPEEPSQRIKVLQQALNPNRKEADDSEPTGNEHVSRG